MARARTDLAAIRSWIARDNPARAYSFVEELEAKAATLIDLPVGYPIVASSRRGAVHKVTHGRYAIYYMRRPGVVEIIHIRHSAMDAPRFA